MMNLDPQLDEEIQKLSAVVKANSLAHTRTTKIYRKYALFYLGKKLTKFAILDSMFFVVRRMIFVASAIWLTTDGSYVLLALGIFMLTSYLQLMYVITVQPYE